MPPDIKYRADDLGILSDIEDRHFWFGARREIILQALARWFGDGQEYLEVGCGTGYLARAVAARFPTWRVVASDPLATSAGSLRLDAHELPYENRFDVIGAYDVLEHIEDDDRVLGQLNKACRPGGGLLLTVPQHGWLWSGADTYAQHFRRYGSRELQRQLRSHGFEIAAATSFQTMTLPFLYARAIGPQRPELTLSVPPAPLNWLFGKLMAVDRRLIGAGVRLPVGGSLLVAARKI
jgi:2-polyprenyl-3-methyl-5-hydroxy-6-metoxy-1,4-benzoquinol methylase